MFFNTVNYQSGFTLRVGLSVLVRSSLRHWTLRVATTTELIA